MRYISIFLDHWVTLLFATIIGGAIAVGLSFIPDQLYESQVDLLIVQQDPDIDAYTAQRAAERLGKNLVNIVESFDFLNRVIATGLVDGSYYSDVAEERSKQWSKAVHAQVIPESSLISVYGYAVSPSVAEDIAVATSQVLATNAADYHGAGQAVVIKEISGPITSTRTVKPNVPLNGAAGAVLAFMAAYTMFLLRAESQRYKDEKQQLHYQLVKEPTLQIPNGTKVGNQDPTEFITPEYSVLDEYPSEPYQFGASVTPSIHTDGPVSMHDHASTTSTKGSNDDDKPMIPKF